MSQTLADRSIQGSFMDSLFHGFMAEEQVGGVGGLSRFTAATHAMAEQSTSVHVRSNWLRLIMEIGKAYDERNQIDGDIPPEELQARMAAAVLEQIHNNADLAQDIFLQAIRVVASQPDREARLDRIQAAITAARDPEVLCVEA